MDLAHTCPNCHSAHECVTGLSGSEKPDNGDLSICFDCNYVSIFNDVGELREPNVMELVDLQNQQPDVWQLVNRAQAALIIAKGL